MSDLPEIRIVWSGVSTEVCAICGQVCKNDDAMIGEVPSAFTVASIEAGDVPVPVCDSCIETSYPAETFAELMAERRRFAAN